jgi:TRAP-type mannitol/chloroaromatic compound transport system permease small subunit
LRQIKRPGQLIDSSNEWLGKVASFFVLVIMAIGVTEVTLRYGFNRPTIWAWDVNIQLFAAFIFLGAGYHLLHRTIVVVDVLYNRFPPKLRAIADLITCLCCLTFSAVIIWGGTVMAVKSWAVMETSRTFFEPPLYYIKTLIPVAGILMAAQWIRQFIRDFAAAISARRREPGEH